MGNPHDPIRQPTEPKPQLVMCKECEHCLPHDKHDLVTTYKIYKCHCTLPPFHDVSYESDGCTFGTKKD